MVQSVERAIDILTYVAESDNPPSLTDISQGLGLSRSSVHRLLACLQAKGVVEKDPANRYRVAALVFRWTRGTPHQGALAALILPFLERLRDETGETASFHMMVGRNHICVEQAESRNELRRSAEMRKAIPLGLGATGKVILAHLAGLNGAAMAQLLNENGLFQVDPHAFQEELARIRQHGVAMTFGERLAGAAAASAPVFDNSGRVIGAISVAGPASRLPPEILGAHARRLKAVAVTVSWELGYRASEGAPEEPSFKDSGGPRDTHIFLHNQGGRR